ncbi:MAG: DUF1573 domain-containing protein [Bacteroidota bacterium]
MKRLIVLFCFSILSATLCNNYAQFSEPSISFSKTSYNFGNINELDGIKSYDFEFINNGSQPLIVHDVTSTCGCTIPEWSREPIAPGSKGKIKVTFDPRGRPGAFRKTITVKSNARESTVTLYIVGLVSPKPKTAADDFPIKMGLVRLSTNHVSMMTVFKNQIKTDTLEFFNDSDLVIALTFTEVPPYLAFQVEPSFLEPGKRGVIRVSYYGQKNSDWGFVMDRVILTVNGKKYQDNLLAISALLEEDFSQLSAEKKANAPRAILSEESFNFGTITAGQMVTHDFVLKNAGTDPLIIRKISSTCGCTASVPETYEIAGGKETIIKCSFDSRGKSGKQFQTVTLILNDPLASTLVLRFMGTVANSGK